MSSFASYKIYNPKKSTSITWFHCAYCNKYQWRRSSKIKNSNLVFCDNSCRAKYVSKLSNKYFFKNEDIQPYLFEFKDKINQISANTATYSKVPNILEDLKKQAPYVIFKCLQNKKTDKISKKYFCKVYKVYLRKYIATFEYSEQSNLSLDSIQNIDKTLDLVYFKDLDFTIDAMNLVNKMIKDIKRLPISCRIVIDREIFNLSIEDCVKKYDMSKRQVVYNCSKGKELLKFKYYAD